MFSILSRLFPVVALGCAPALLSLPVLGGAGDPGWLARAWQYDEGLPDNNVTGVAQTPDGYLWVGTRGGLARFDGARSQGFSPASLPGVPNRVVHSVFADSRGHLWLGMDRGPVVCVRPDSADVFTISDGLSDANKTSMTEDGKGALWVGYLDGAVVRIQGRDVRRFGSDDGLPEVGASWVAADVQGRLWFARGRHVGIFEDGNFRTLLTFDESALVVGAARGGGVWICAGARFFRYDGESELEPVGELPAEGRVNPTAILEDSGGSVWIGTSGSGLFRFDGLEIEPAETSHRGILCLAEDHEGGMWVGTAGGGLNRLRPRSVKLWGEADGLPFETVHSVCEDGEGTLWVVTGNGMVARRDSVRWTVPAGLGWAAGYARCIAADREGGIWIGTRDRGLRRFHEGEFTVWNEGDGLAGRNVRCLLVSSTGDVWIGLESHKKLQRLRDGVFHTFETPPATRSIRAMTEDASGTIWVGTSDGQLWRIVGDSLEDATPTDTRVSIRSLHATADGSLWIGYAGWGLGRLKDGRFARATLAQGLHDRYISQIASDDDGWLWIGANRGIFQLRIERLIDVLEGREEHVRSILYGRGEGLPSLHVSMEHSPAAVRSRNGRIFIATHKGLAEVYPTRIQDHPTPPRVQLEHVNIDGEPAALYDSRFPLRSPHLVGLLDLRSPIGRLRLPADHRRIDFGFTALSFTAPENIHFRYRLKGFDDDWVEAGAQRHASYPRLPAGDYQFDVLAGNHVGVWNDAPVTVAFTVLPFFWQTWWFRLAVVAGVTFGVTAVVRSLFLRRLRREMRLAEHQVAVHRERARIAKDIHDDVGASLTQIALMGELALQDRVSPDKVGPRVEKIAVNARQAIKSLDEIVWAVNPGNDTVAHLVDYTGQFAFDFLRESGVRCRLDFPESVPEHEVPTDVRHNLFLVVKEALHNVVKHADATEVRLRIQTDDHVLTLEVKDNGCGFDRPPTNGEADGLRNMRQRIAEIGGEYRIQSRSGAGTTVLVVFRWPNGNGRGGNQELKTQGFFPVDRGEAGG